MKIHFDLERLLDEVGKRETALIEEVIRENKDRPYEVIEELTSWCRVAQFTGYLNKNIYMYKKYEMNIDFIVEVCFNEMKKLNIG